MRYRYLLTSHTNLKYYIFSTGKVPAGTRCTFENGWCGWKNATDKHNTLKWKLNRGSTRNEHTGPSHDNTFANETGNNYYPIEILEEIMLRMFFMMLRVMNYNTKSFT